MALIFQLCDSRPPSTSQQKQITQMRNRRTNFKKRQYDTNQPPYCQNNGKGFNNHRLPRFCTALSGAKRMNNFQWQFLTSEISDEEIGVSL